MRDQPFFDTKKINSWFDALTKADAKTRITQEPVMMMILTTLAAQKAFGMKA